MMGRIGGLRRSALHDSREMTAKARSTFLAKFIVAVDPDGALPEEERLRRAEIAKKEHFTRLAMASVEARRKFGGGGKTRRAGTTNAHPTA